VAAALRILPQQSADLRSSPPEMEMAGPLEAGLMVLCGVLHRSFTLCVFTSTW